MVKWNSGLVNIYEYHILPYHYKKAHLLSYPYHY
jgi:hypothetical protein